MNLGARRTIIRPRKCKNNSFYLFFYPTHDEVLTGTFISSEAFSSNIKHLFANALQFIYLYQPFLLSHDNQNEIRSLRSLYLWTEAILSFF